MSSRERAGREDDPDRPSSGATTRAKNLIGASFRAGRGSARLELPRIGAIKRARSQETPEIEEANRKTPDEAEAEAGSDDPLSRAALDYHRYPTPGKIPVTPTKDMTTQRDLALAYSPGVAFACVAIEDDPQRSLQPHRARQSGRGDLQRHRRARPGQHRPAGRQAGDGRQGLPVPEVRRHRRVRHRDRRDRPRQAGRHHRQPGADLRRHQPGGHQGAGVLRRRDASCASA